MVENAFLIHLDIGRSLLFPEDEPVRYYLKSGDGNRAEGKEVVHIYTDPGTYQVSMLAVNPRSEHQRSMRITVPRRAEPAEYTVTL